VIGELGEPVVVIRMGDKNLDIRVIPRSGVKPFDPPRTQVTVFLERRQSSRLVSGQSKAI